MADQFDWAAYAEAVAVNLFGKPNKAISRPPDDVRFGNDGSVRVNYVTGQWSDSVLRCIGGVREMIGVYEEIKDHDAAVAYAEECQRKFENGGANPNKESTIRGQQQEQSPQASLKKPNDEPPPGMPATKPEPANGPPTEWRTPTELPDLRRVDEVALDTETKDDGINAGRGSAWPWHDGYICGVSAAYRADGKIRAHYFPIRHPDSENLNPAQVFAWVKDLVASNVRIVTQNGLYDWGWLRTEANIKMPPSERLEEVLALATLVDENLFNYKLDTLCGWRGLPGKDETLLREAATAAGFKISKKTPLQSFIHQLPARYVGRYPEQDPTSTLLLSENLKPILNKEGTREAYRLEIDLLPMVHEMRRRGIRVDQSAAEQARDECLQKRDTTLAELSKQLGSQVSMAEIASSKWKERTFDAYGIDYPRTAKGNPSFKAGKLGWMATHPHWLPQLIAKTNKYHFAGSTFLQGHILEHLIGDRIYGEINPHRSEEGGTKSFRFSYADPPLQQMPSRDEELAPLIRRVFLPEEGEIWCTVDCSQQEFRLLAHHAFIRNLPSVAAVVERYRNDLKADFHVMASEMTALVRKDAKGFNFAKIYGAGVKKIAEMLGKPLSEAQIINARYDQKLPFISQLAQLCQYEANRSGYTRLYDGALRHWDRWAPRNYTKGAGPCSLEEAQQRTRDPKHPWFNRALQRVGIHTALNAQIQGDAARHTKLWMRAVWREGIVPLLQMHDGLELSVTTHEQGERVAELACEAVKLEVPMRADIKYGRSWGDATHNREELHGLPAPVPAPTPVSAPTALSAPSAIIGVQVLPPAAGDAISTHDKPWRRIPLADLISLPLSGGKVLCPFHDDHRPSCHIYADHFYCFVCGAHGDHIDWLREVEGLNFQEALDALADWKPQERAAEVKPKDDGRTLGFAHQLWREAGPITDTPAERYLREVRGIDVTALPTDCEHTLRFHPNCPFGGQRQPCLLALYRDVVTDVEAGIHRIALTTDVFAGGKVQRLTLGLWPQPRAIKLWPIGSQLFLGEGIETVLAAATRLQYRGAPMRPAWAAGCSAPIRKFPVLPGVGRLVLLVDQDPAGEACTEACRQTWRNAGRGAIRLRPQRSKDFNDIVLEKLGVQ
jgi:DNA polymerase I-like protein with 3'-5' exonuclease and polymerase domains